MDITVLIPTIGSRLGLGGPYERAVTSAQTQTFPPTGGVLVELDVDRTGAAATRNRLLERTEAVRAAGGFQAHPDENGDPCEDWGLWLAMHAQGAKFGHLPVKTWLWNNDADSTRGRPDRW
jgi:hypothetical protein